MAIFLLYCMWTPEEMHVMWQKNLLLEKSRIKLIKHSSYAIFNKNHSPKFIEPLWDLLEHTSWTKHQRTKLICLAKFCSCSTVATLICFWQGEKKICVEFNSKRWKGFIEPEQGVWERMHYLILKLKPNVYCIKTVGTLGPIVCGLISGGPHGNEQSTLG